MAETKEELKKQTPPAAPAPPPPPRPPQPPPPPGASEGIKAGVTLIPVNDPGPTPETTITYPGGPDGDAARNHARRSRMIQEAREAARPAEPPPKAGDALYEILHNMVGPFPMGRRVRASSFPEGTQFPVLLAHEAIKEVEA